MAAHQTVQNILAPNLMQTTFQLRNSLYVAKHKTGMFFSTEPQTFHGRGQAPLRAARVDFQITKPFFPPCVRECVSPAFVVQLLESSSVPLLLLELICPLSVSGPENPFRPKRSPCNEAMPRDCLALIHLGFCPHGPPKTQKQPLVGRQGPPPTGTPGGQPPFLGCLQFSILLTA